MRPFSQPSCCRLNSTYHGQAHCLATTAHARRPTASHSRPRDRELSRIIFGIAAIVRKKVTATKDVEAGQSLCVYRPDVVAITFFPSRGGGAPPRRDRESCARLWRSRRLVVRGRSDSSAIEARGARRGTAGGRSVERRVSSHLTVRGYPCPLTGRSLRPSWASLTRSWLRFGIYAFAGQLRRPSVHWDPEASVNPFDSFEEGARLPMPSSGLWERAQPWMAQRSGHAVNGGLEGRSERPARGYGQPRDGLGVQSP
jgi:hypothetical protein